MTEDHFAAIAAYHVMVILMRQANIPEEQAITLLHSYAHHGPNQSNAIMVSVAATHGIDLSCLLITTRFQ